MDQAEKSLLIVDDHRMFSESLRALIARRLPEIQRITSARSSREALALLRKASYTLALLDIRLAGNGPDVAQSADQTTEHSAGLVLCSQIRRQFPKTKILILSAYSELYFVQQARLLGADGYLLKDLPISTLIVGIHRVLSGGSYFDEANLDSFELREIEEQVSYLHPRIVQMLLVFLEQEGPSNQELASLMGLREKTVRNYMSQVYDQLDIHSRSKLLVWLQNHEVYLRNAHKEKL